VDILAATGTCINIVDDFHLRVSLVKSWQYTICPVFTDRVVPLELFLGMYQPEYRYYPQFLVPGEENTIPGFGSTTGEDIIQLVYPLDFPGNHGGDAYFVQSFFQYSVVPGFLLPVCDDCPYLEFQLVAISNPSFLQRYFTGSGHRDSNWFLGNAHILGFKCVSFSNAIVNKTQSDGLYREWLP
jgi:hypothetical protein